MNMQPQDKFRADVNREDVLTPFDVREQSGKAAMLKLFGAAAFLLIIAFILLKVYQPGTRDRVEPPKIVADNTPFKVEPVDKGGQQTPDQDKTVYDRIDGTNSAGTVTTAPLPEEPITLPKTAKIVVDSPAPIVRDKPKPVVQAPEPVTVPAPAPVTRQPAIASGSSEYVVQVASSRDRADADRLWRKIEVEYRDILPSGAYADIKRADLGDKGVYHRLRLSGLANKDAATQLCNRLKARGQACFVTR